MNSMSGNNLIYWYCVVEKATANWYEKQNKKQQLIEEKKN